MAYAPAPTAPRPAITAPILPLLGRDLKAFIIKPGSFLILFFKHSEGPVPAASPTLPPEDKHPALPSRILVHFGLAFVHSVRCASKISGFHPLPNLAKLAVIFSLFSCVLAHTSSGTFLIFSFKVSCKPNCPLNRFRRSPS